MQHDCGDEMRRMQMSVFVNALASMALMIGLPGCDDGGGATNSTGATSTSTSASGAASSGTTRPAGVGEHADASPSVINQPQRLPRSSVAENPQGYPPIEFEPREMQFGILPPDGKGEGTATLYNVGTEPLRIKATRGSCSCVDAPNLTGQAIPPGGSIQFKTGMTMKSGLGEKHQRFVLFFDRVDVPVFYDLRAEVSLPVRVSPPHLDAVATMSGTVQVASLDGKPFTILACNRKPPQFEGFDPASERARPSYNLKWDLSEEDRTGSVPWFWVIETDRADCPVVDVRIRHNATKPDRPQGRLWEPGDQRFLLGAITPNEPIELITHVEYAGNVKPTVQDAGARSDSPRMDVEFIEVWVDGQDLNIKVRLTAKPASPGLFYEQLSVSSGGFWTPISIIGRVAE